jgi:predicted nucleic acid-binding protein
VIYLDTSVVLAHLLAEDRRPADTLWDDTLISSRLLEYEVWNRLHARGSAVTHGDMARELLQRLALLELAPPVLSRALEPFPVGVHRLFAHAAAGSQARQLRYTYAASRTRDGYRNRGAVDADRADRLTFGSRSIYPDIHCVLQRFLNDAE